MANLFERERELVTRHMQYLYHRSEDKWALLVLVVLPALAISIATIALGVVHLTPSIGASAALLVSMVGVLTTIAVNALSLPVRPGLSLLVKNQLRLWGRWVLFAVCAMMNWYVFKTLLDIWQLEFRGDVLLSRWFIYTLAGVGWFMGVVVPGIYLGWNLPPTWVHDRLIDFVKVDAMTTMLEKMRGYYSDRYAWLVLRTKDRDKLSLEEVDALNQLRLRMMGELKAIGNGMAGQIVPPSVAGKPAKLNLPNEKAQQARSGGTQMFLRDVRDAQDRKKESGGTV